MWGEKITAFFDRFRKPVVPVLGFAWYTQEQWPLLLKVSTDAQRLEPTHDLWLKNAESRYAELMSQGKNVQKIVVDVVDLAAWCSEMGRTVDSEGRSAYIVYRLFAKRIAFKVPTNAHPPTSL